MSNLQLQGYLESIVDTKSRAVLQAISGIVVDNQQRIIGLTSQLTSCVHELDTSKQTIMSLELQVLSLEQQINELQQRLSLLEQPE